MKIHSTLIAGVALAAMVLVPIAPAAAGGGVQLNFGGPLGTFTARPHGGGQYGSGHSHRAHSARKHDYARKEAIAERKAAARGAKIAKARQLEAERRKVAATRKAEEISKRKAVAAANLAEDEPEIAKAEVSRIEEVAKPEKIVQTDEIERTETAQIAERVPAKGSSIIAVNTLAPVAAIASGNASSEVLLKTIDVETKVNPGTEVAANEKDGRFPGEPDNDTPQSCKKFVPSAGLTITVPCGD